MVAHAVQLPSSMLISLTKDVAVVDRWSDVQLAGGCWRHFAWMIASHSLATFPWTLKRGLRTFENHLGDVFKLGEGPPVVTKQECNTTTSIHQYPSTRHAQPVVLIILRGQMGQRLQHVERGIFDGEKKPFSPSGVEHFEDSEVLCCFDQRHHVCQ